MGASWSSALLATEIPSNEGAKETFAAAKGLVPWMEDTDTPHPAVEQKFSHTTAPNLIFFLVDDWGHNDPGYQSSVWPTLTPNINKLAGEGVILTNYFSHEKCSPSRSAFLTGRYSVRTGLHGLGDGELPSSEYLIGEELRTAGYATHIIGKWHMGFSTWAKTPLYRGFDTFFGYGGDCFCFGR
jgi:arylsulfatase A-like enzyme